jgi:SAM-dependent methyltransferase
VTSGTPEAPARSAQADPSVAHDRDPASFRDPSGFIYRRAGVVLRQINASYGAHWDALVASGFLDRLVADGRLLPFERVGLELAADPAIAHAVIAPRPLGFVSYPYEWTFSQLRDAALLTLDLQDAAQAAGFVLKDATAYNIQFVDGRPVLVDTLSFEPAVTGRPWAAYRQFCQHFLAPLALMAYRDVRCGLMLREHLDGIPLDLACRLMPGRSRLRFGLLSHLHLHSRAERRYGQKRGRAGTGAATTAAAGDDGGATDSPAPPTRGGPAMSDLRRAALIDSLRSTIRRLRWDPAGTEWADYATNTSYASSAAEAKDRVVEAMLAAAGGDVVWDLGANTGRFSAIAARLGRDVLAFDIDPGAAELHYRALRAAGTTAIQPLVMDLANPSPGLGWAGAERRPLADRANADTILALALIHHLAIGRNVPLPAIADWFARLAPHAIVEFVPKADPMVRFLLESREDVFADYDLDGFRAAMATRFETVQETPLPDSPRVLFHLRRR